MSGNPSVFSFVSIGHQLAAATSDGIYQSDDTGLTWKLMSRTRLIAHALAVLGSTQGPGLLLAGGPSGLQRSSDAGNSWQTTLVGSPITALSLSQDRLGEQIGLAGTETDGIFRSPDGGTTWMTANAGLLDLETIALTCSPSFAMDNTGFAGTASGLYRTRNGGKAWNSLPLPAPQPAVQCLALAPEFRAMGVILAGTEADGLFRSPDGGRTWLAVPTLRDGGVTALTWSRVTPSLVLASTSEGIIRSNDAGETWERISAMGIVLSLLLVPAPAGETVLAGLVEGGIMRSTDGGATWHTVTFEVPAEVMP